MKGLLSKLTIITIKENTYSWILTIFLPMNSILNPFILFCEIINKHKLKKKELKIEERFVYFNIFFFYEIIPYFFLFSLNLTTSIKYEEKMKSNRKKSLLNKN